MDREVLEDVAKRVVEEVVKAYDFIRDRLGVEIPLNIVERVLEEVKHIAIHELSHGVIRVVYPEIESLEDHDLAECIDEVASRLIETYVSRGIGTYVHSFEEHIHELRYYPSLTNIDIEARDLEELYREFEEGVRSGRIREAIEIVAKRCASYLGKG